MSKEHKQAPQWERIELDYRAGIKSLRQIAAEQGISEGAIRKRAKRDDWSRDLSERIQEKAEQLVRKEAVRSEVRAERTASEREVVDANAQALATIRLAHRRDIQRARKITNALLDELEQMADADTVAYLQELGEMLRSPDDNGMDKLNDLYQKVISLPEPAMRCCAVILTNCALSLTACASNLQMPPADLPALLASVFEYATAVTKTAA